MIMELSKKNRDKGRRPAAADRSALLEALQRSAASSGGGGGAQRPRHGEVPAPGRDLGQRQRLLRLPPQLRHPGLGRRELRRVHPAREPRRRHAAAPLLGRRTRKRGGKRGRARRRPRQRAARRGAGRKPEAAQLHPAPQGQLRSRRVRQRQQEVCRAGRPHSAHSAPVSKPAPAQSRPEQGAPPCRLKQGRLPGTPASGGVAPSPTPVAVPTPRSVVPDEPASVPRTSPRPRDLPSGPPPKALLPIPSGKGMMGVRSRGPPQPIESRLATALWKSMWALPHMATCLQLRAKPWRGRVLPQSVPGQQ
ncbi:hypothetical protein ANANG_G00015070 [Anguilla anguilla]|uniref:Uncharacterized protein n=1 Tax=Anguilla anguilla TaxID=7936 RepID=A0A9D3MY87_ANGAN|nr:hypothetical protein ANANG_G00015070 [Anguilla anguilla]